jgi:hypothetical protein
MASNSALAILSLSGARRRGLQEDRWALCSPDVMDCVVAKVSLNSSGTNEVWKLGKESVDRSTATDDFDAGIRELAADNDVTPSSRRLFRQSTKRPKCDRKSAPMRG